MNPLAAIRQMIPGMGAVPTPAASPARIPGADLEQLASTARSTVSESRPGQSFSGVLDRVVGEVNDKQLQAAQSVQDLQSGNAASLHQTMIALEEASVSFQLMVEVRNKVLEGYQELMRMQI